MSEHELIERERAGWEALSTAGDDAADWYSQVLARNVLMLLPGALVIDDREQVIASMRGAPWTSFQLEDERVFGLTDDCAVVAYRATSEREGNQYAALYTSTYVREDGAWKLAIHQQTPLSAA